jgi:hypothetical protein
MDKSRQEILEWHDRLVAMLPSVRKWLHEQFPDVLGVDVGIKESHGELTNVLAFRVHVRRKKSMGELRPEEVIPNEIRGVPTDILVVKDAEPETDLLTGGIQIEGSGGIGTLGCFVTLDTDPVADKKIYILSNHHVLMGSSGAAGDKICHPSKCMSPCCHCNDVAELVAASAGAPGSAGNLIDAGYARILDQGTGVTNSHFFSNTIEGIGPVFGSTAAVPFDIIRKHGRTTGLTYGIVVSVTFPFALTVEEGQPTAGYINQMDINPVQPSTDWSEGGDSGSAVVNRFNQVVGLHFAGPRGGPEGRANNINNVLSTAAGGFGLTVLSSGTAGALPLSGVAVQDFPIVKPQNTFLILERALKSSEAGKCLYNAFRENRGEVMDLINDNREVKVAWHRYHGPAYLGHALKAARDSNYPFPMEIETYSLHHLLLKMSEVLERHGSRKLSKAVEDYSLVLFDFADQLQQEKDLLKALNKLGKCPVCGKVNALNHYGQ